MRLVFILSCMLCLCLCVPIFAQGAFVDVPVDHWAYDAVNTLQRQGIIIGYPDGTFGGKRAMTRYEFAVAIARLLPLIGQGGPGAPGEPGSPGTSGTISPNTYVTEGMLNDALAGYARKSDIPDISNLATKADLDAIRRLVDEFRVELDALGVDVDSLRRDVSALTARVEALEAENRRVRFNGNANIFGISGSSKDGDVVDLDERTIADNDKLLRNISVVTDFDLELVGRVSDSVTANATINYGNYLNYLRYVDDYIDGRTPTRKGDIQDGKNFEDSFFPYYLYIDAMVGNMDITVGRFPIQWTPYTLKMIDVDSYSSILKTDAGDYPMDGVKLSYGRSGIDLALFAAKNGQNDYLANGLTGQPNSGLYYNNRFNSVYGHDHMYGPFNEAGGNSVGGLRGAITQSAGARLSVNLPWKGSIGATYYQAWSEEEYDVLAAYDQARVYGADVAMEFGSIGLIGSWTKSTALARDKDLFDNVDDDNTAWDAKLAFNFGKLGLDAGYKHIERNFAAAGAWDKIGRWTNPTNIKGPYVNLTYPVSSKFNFVLNGEWLKAIEDVSFMAKNDKVLKAEGGLRWGISEANAMTLGIQWIQYKPDGDFDKATERYITVGWAHQFTPNAGLKLGYQFINWDGGDDSIVYGSDYKGARAVAQFGVSF